MAEFKARVTTFLRRAGEQLARLTLARTPGALGAFIDLTGNLLRMHLLAGRAPYRQIMQLYTLAFCTVEVSILPLSYT
jgi:hypothetical protein